jgi:type II secretory pathway pseudopilin PulG
MKRSSSVFRRRAGGFTFIWVLLVVAMMGLGLTVVAELDSIAVQRDREAELLAIGRQFRDAIGRYVQAQGRVGQANAYPSSLEDLLQDPRLPGVHRHLRKIFVDPMTGKAEWGLVTMGGRIVGVHSLSERTPIKQDGFEPEDMTFRGKTRYAQWTFTYPANLMVQAEAAPGLAGNPGLSQTLDGAAPHRPTQEPEQQYNELDPSSRNPGPDSGSGVDGNRKDPS